MQTTCARSMTHFGGKASQAGKVNARTESSRPSIHYTCKSDRHSQRVRQCQAFFYMGASVKVAAVAHNLESHQNKNSHLDKLVATFYVRHMLVLVRY